MTTTVGLLRERVAERHSRTIGSVAAARRRLEFDFYALRDCHVRAWRTCRGWHERCPRLPLGGAGRAGHDPRCGVVVQFRLTPPSSASRTPSCRPGRGEGITGSLPGLPTQPDPGHDKRNAKPILAVRDARVPVSAAHIVRRPRRRPQGSSTTARSGSARALTPTPISTCSLPPKTASNLGHPSLDRPLSYGDDRRTADHLRNENPSTWEVVRLLRGKDDSCNN